MSGLKPPALTEFYRSLHARGLSSQQLAEVCGVSRPALSRVLNGSRRRGPIWAKVRPHLTAVEIEYLDVAQLHPWNSKRVARRPRWASLAPLLVSQKVGAIVRGGCRTPKSTSLPLLSVQKVGAA